MADDDRFDPKQIDQLFGIRRNVVGLRTRPSVTRIGAVGPPQWIDDAVTGEAWAIDLSERTP